MLEKIILTLFTDPIFEDADLNYRIELVHAVRNFSFEKYEFLNACYSAPLEYATVADNPLTVEFLEAKLITIHYTQPGGLFFGVTEKGRNALVLLKDVYPNENCHTEKFAQRLKKARLALNMTQNDLAKSAGSNQRTVCQLENGKASPQTQTLNKLASALSVDPDWLKTGY
jgi:DNA-binding XRE family transcriptional regulator